MIAIQIQVGKKILTGNLLENATAQALIANFPLTLPMLNLYAREMTYRFKNALPASETKTTSYHTGDIAYWAPRHSFVIFYKQTGEVISHLQLVGHINSDLSFMSKLGNTEMQFKLK
ncbi:cyclophilin-like fold protein [Pediococcus siamensis]|uniref:cyclophilin-like fold protein n=1 Tax=Pediococcus siamensis TaxID=381829 RepID=UPI0039A35E2B